MNNLPDENNIGDEFRTLGKNISTIFRTAWESQERRDIQKEIEEGLNEIISSLNKAAVGFQESNTGQRLKQDISDLNRRFQNGEVEGKIRKDISEVLSKINRELENNTHRWTSKPDQESTSEPIPESPPDTEK